MKSIHFSLIQSFSYYSKLINVTQARSYLNMSGLKAKLTYQYIEATKIYINSLEPGQRVSDLPDLDHVVQLINNYYNSRPLLENIPYTEMHKKIFDSIDSYYDKKLDYDCVFFSCYCTFVLAIIYASFVIKKNNPDIDIVVGGIQVDLSKSTTGILKHLDTIDYVVSGDIEVALEKYLKDELKRSDFLIGNIDIKTLEMQQFYSPEVIVDKNLLINTSRSCPFRCSFCSGTIGPLRALPVETVISGIKEYNKWADRYYPRIYFTDNTFNFSKKRIHDICDGLIGINNKIPLEAYFVYNNIDTDIIKKLAKANFNIIRIGLDAFAPEKRRYAKKNFDITKEEIIEIANAITENGMVNQIFIIFGMPNETPESFNIDFGLAKELRVRDNVEVFPFFYGLSVGSDIYDNPTEYDVTFEYWKTKKCVIPEITDIVNRTPRFYFCNVTPQQYIEQFKTLRPILSSDDGYKSTTLELEKLMREHLL